MSNLTSKAVASVAALSLVTTAGAQAASTSSTPSKSDRDFMIKDFHGGYYEIATSRVVLAKKGAPAAAKSLARTLISAHTKEVAELKKLATSQGVPVKPTLTRLQKAEVSQLKTLSAKNLGARFTKLEFDDHTSEIKEYGKMRATTKDAALKAYIVRWLPQYRMHAAKATSAHKAITGWPA